MSNQGYRYTGTGERFRGVPARDLTQDEYDALGPREQRSVGESGMYALIEPEGAQLSKSMSREDLETRAIEAGIAGPDAQAAKNKEELIALIESATVPPSPNDTSDHDATADYPSAEGDN